MNRFSIGRLIAALGFVIVPPCLSQVPEEFHPLWENSPEAESQAVPPVVGDGSPPSFANPGSPPPQGFAALAVEASVSAEIAALAAALGNDPVRIFNHVRNTIDYDLYHGLRKGPELTLLEGSGNDLDTCSLLAELLKAAGHSQIKFCYQRREVPISGNNSRNLAEWVGLADEPFPGKPVPRVRDRLGREAA
jgi:hypothetical protein